MSNQENDRQQSILYKATLQDIYDTIHETLFGIRRYDLAIQ